MGDAAPSWRSVEARAVQAESTISSKSGTTAALKATIESAELYMQALKLTDSPTDRKRLDSKCKELINRAEALKNEKDGLTNDFKDVPLLTIPLSRRKLTTRENIILLEGSKLNGFIFKPWDKEPEAQEFVLMPGEQPFTDLPTLALSEVQLECFDGWKRPAEALSAVRFPGTGEDREITMSTKNLSKIDLVQDLTSDCSVVASLCAGSSRVARGHQKISSTSVYPWDHKEQTLAVSPNGKYILKLYFNGCWRRVEIDDRLPTSKTERVLHVVDRRRPGLLWPALVEKAYLKVRGGYDFPGSNSGTDLAVITGWIPQQVFLHDDEVDPDSLWEELFAATRDGHVIITLGTGKLSRREQKQLGLAAEHDYAVLELKERSGIRELLVKNPWADGDVWKGAARRRPNPNSEDDPSSPRTEDSEQMVPGTFWMDFNSVFQHYENLYINWNPGLFDHRQDRHFSWTLAEKTSAASLLEGHHQFVLQTTKTSEVWLLLNRHFQTGDYTHANSGKNGYISLYVFDKQGYRVLSRENAHTRGPFVDSPNTLVRLEAIANKSYTVAILQSDLPAGKQNFTLSLFSHCPATLEEATPRYPHNISLSSAWTRDTAGGSSDSPQYLSNPQFQLKLAVRQPIAFILRRIPSTSSSRASESVHVKLSILHASSAASGRITRLRPRDIVAHSGDYHVSSAVVETTLAAGTYTIIASTFDPQQLSAFTLTCLSSQPICTPTAFRNIPPESYGRLSTRIPVATFPPGIDRLLLPLTVQRVTKAIFNARPPQLQHRHTTVGSLFKLSLELGQGPYKRTIADSAFDDGGEEFHAVGAGLRIEDLDLRPEWRAASQGGLWLVLERLSRGEDGDEGHDSGSEAECLVVEVLSEESIEIGAWGIGEG